MPCTMWWIIVTLILAGIVLMLVEMLLIPGVGVAGILSLASIAAACWYAFKFIGPDTGRWVTLIAAILLAVMLFFILRSKTWEKFALRTEVDSKVNEEGEKVKVGDRGIALTRLAPIGTGKFAETSCEVKSHDNSMVTAGTKIEVVEIEENRPLVKPIIEE